MLIACRHKLGCGCALGHGCGDPGVQYGSFSTVIRIFQLEKVEVNLLWRIVVSMTSFQRIERDSYGLRLLTSTPLRMDRTKGTRGLMSNPPGAGVRNGKLTISGGLGCKQPDSLSSLDRVPFVSISTGAALKGAVKLGLDETMSLELMVFQPSDITVSS